MGMVTWQAWFARPYATAPWSCCGSGARRTRAAAPVWRCGKLKLHLQTFMSPPALVRY